MSGLRPLLLAAFLLTACAPRGITEGDRLRERVLDLEAENERLAGRIAELEAERAAAAAAPGSLPAEVQDAIPHVTSIGIGRLSHAAGADGDGVPDQVIVYISPRDGRGRFVQLVGTIDVHVAILPLDGDADTLGRVQLGPGAVRDAYRSGLTGTHYTIEVPISPPAPATDTGMTVKVRFTDSRTGRVLEAERGL